MTPKAAVAMRSVKKNARRPARSLTVRLALATPASLPHFAAMIHAPLEFHAGTVSSFLSRSFPPLLPPRIERARFHRRAKPMRKERVPGKLDGDTSMGPLLLAGKRPAHPCKRAIDTQCTVGNAKDA